MLLYEMLVGYPPFEGTEPLSLYRAIVLHEVRYPKTMGANAQSLLEQLLATQPEERIGTGKGGADELKRHGFYKKMAWHAVLLKKIEAPYKPKSSAGGEGAAEDAEEVIDDEEADEEGAAASFPPDAFEAFRELTASFDGA